MKLDVHWVLPNGDQKSEYYCSLSTTMRVFPPSKRPIASACTKTYTGTKQQKQILAAGRSRIKGPRSWKSVISLVAWVNLLWVFLRIYHLWDSSRIGGNYFKCLISGNGRVQWFSDAELKVDRLDFDGMEIVIADFNSRVICCRFDVGFSFVNNQ